MDPVLLFLGPAGAICAENLRSGGFTGRVVFILGEHHLPYDRPKLSKAFDITESAILLRNIAFYEERHIELKLGVKLTKISPSEKTISLDDNSSLSYDKIFLATGSR